MIRAAVSCGVVAVVLAPGAAGAAERYVLGGTYTTPHAVVGAPLVQLEVDVHGRRVGPDPLVASEDWASGAVTARTQVDHCGGRTSTAMTYGADGTVDGRPVHVGPATASVTPGLVGAGSCEQPADPPAGGGAGAGGGPGGHRGDGAEGRPGRRCGQAACDPPERGTARRPHA